MKVLILAILLMHVTNTHAQSKEKCSDNLKYLSFFWTKDSLANNGFRSQVIQRFLSCEIDKIDTSLLVSKLGRPSFIQVSAAETHLVYCYYDGTQIPSSANFTPEKYYLTFNFKRESGLLVSIAKTY